MRLKTYTAATMNQAMDLVREELGDDAIIVSTQKASDGQGARVTAALEDTFQDEVVFAATNEAEPDDVTEAIRQTLSFHGTPGPLADALARTAGKGTATDATLALASALDEHYRFSPLDQAGSGRPLILVGPPCAGKTIVTAKLCARAGLQGKTVKAITTDTKRAGGVEQLEAFTRILKADLGVAETGKELEDAVRDAYGADFCFIDSPGTNPYSEAEVDSLADLIRLSHAEPVLVLAAGSDAFEMADMALAFRQLGAERLIVTRLDLARRIGGMLAAADAAGLAFSDVSTSPHIADGLAQVNPASLARLIMPHAADKPSEYLFRSQAVS
ncbi:MAG: GTP-binding protein [Magnetovibrionaceae bacterium]